MEWHFLRLVLALLPEGVLAVVGHNFVLETGLKGEEKVEHQTLWPVE